MANRFIVSLAAVTILAAYGGGSADSRVALLPSDIAGPLQAAAVEADVPYVPTPQRTVEEMLRMAKVSRDDLVYDLGSGDGRIVITAAKEYGARGVGIDIDPQLVADAKQNAFPAGVTDRVKFIQGDLFSVNLRDATAVTLYLLSSVNLRLRPKLLDELRPGTPVVSHNFDMGDWEPDEEKWVGRDRLFLWIIPARVDGTWSWTTEAGQRRTLVLRQEFQKLAGQLQGDERDLEVRNGRVNGEEVTFELARDGSGGGVVERYSGRVNGGTISGTAEAGGRRWQWRARHE